jgi:nitrogenase molybdenum-iron protein alpha/beta subunit
VPVKAPDYAGGLEQGYAAAVEAMLSCVPASVHTDRSLVNILAGPHLTPADIYEIKDIICSFGLRAIVLPDLSALDGSRQGISPLSEGGTSISDIRTMGQAGFTFAVGACMEASANKLKEISGIEYSVLGSIAGLADTDSFMKMLSIISGRDIPVKYQRQRRMLVDTHRDAHFFTAGKSICLALDESHAVQTSRWVTETGASVRLAVVPHETSISGSICAEKTICGGLWTIEGDYDLVIANSHASATAARLGIAHYEMGFPILKSLGYPQRVTIGYSGSIAMINDIANLLAKEAHP